MSKRKLFCLFACLFLAWLLFPLTTAYASTQAAEALENVQCVLEIVNPTENVMSLSGTISVKTIWQAKDDTTTNVPVTLQTTLDKALKVPAMDAQASYYGEAYVLNATVTVDKNTKKFLSQGSIEGPIDGFSDTKGTGLNLIAALKASQEGFTLAQQAPHQSVEGGVEFINDGQKVLTVSGSTEIPTVYGNILLSQDILLTASKAPLEKSWTGNKIRAVLKIDPDFQGKIESEIYGQINHLGMQPVIIRYLFTADPSTSSTNPNVTNTSNTTATATPPGAKSNVASASTKKPIQTATPTPTKTPTATTTPTPKQSHTDAIAGTGNYFAFPQCTWWANERYHQLFKVWVPWTMNANANQWPDRAREFKWHVGHIPTVGAIVVLNSYVQGASALGHVSVVEKLLSNGHILTSNTNWGVTPTKVTYVEITPGPGVSFITRYNYDK